MELRPSTKHFLLIIDNPKIVSSKSVRISGHTKPAPLPKKRKKSYFRREKLFRTNLKDKQFKQKIDLFKQFMKNNQNGQLRPEPNIMT